MAARTSTLNKPGEIFGPCLEGCTHQDCAETRRMAEIVCLFCEKPVGYETRFYRIHDDKETKAMQLVHASCFEDDIDMRKIDDHLEAIKLLAAGKHQKFRRDLFDEMTQIVGNDVIHQYIRNILSLAAEVINGNSY